jgi:hypothetical protein
LGFAITCCLLFIQVSFSFGASDSVFALSEIRVSSSPAGPRRLVFPAAEKPLDFDVSPLGPEVAVLVKNASGTHKVALWNMALPEGQTVWGVPRDVQPRTIAWHPTTRRFFLAGVQGAQFVILSVSEAVGGWEAKTIYRSPHEIRRLAPAPRPFVTDFEKRTYAYRLFFGEKTTEGVYVVKSVTEEGSRVYQALGPQKGSTELSSADGSPSLLRASWALPLALHPAGHLLIWEDDKHCFNVARYTRDHWGSTEPLFGGALCGGAVTPTPNGIGLIHWQPGTPGVVLYLDQGKIRSTQAAQYTFLSTPSSAPDGKGIVGLVQSDKGPALVYVPIEVPLADVVNAWMFLQSPEDRTLFAANRGLLRDLENDQLYSLYDSENYYCGGYDESTPTRPYLVTTDIFWEIFAAAYEGMFIVREQQEAIPAFWEFVRRAHEVLRTAPPDSRWAAIFATLAKLREGKDHADAEMARILRAEGRARSSVLNDEFDYGELKPRGHYTSRPELAAYFKAFRYLTQVAEQVPSLSLRALPPDVKASALEWIRSYENFIAPPRAPLVWSVSPFSPLFLTKPTTKTSVFPLSWGFDNRTLFSTVYHEDWPEADQIKGPGGLRLAPSGLDVAAALGSRFARTLLADEINKYPPLGRVLDQLHERFAASAEFESHSPNLYQRWMTALAVQWAEDTASPNGSTDEKLWRTKRLQTGLASWATLRHATVLVNERTAAECGEGGFEAIVLRPPRGYVEPDPRTFGAIADLFDATAQQIQSADRSFQGSLPTEASADREPLRQGILSRLRETAKKARLFRTIAEKELRGEPLTNSEYEEILYVGRIAEHHFLVFKSLANKELALSNPDPMPKIVDVAGGGPYRVPYLMAAVGRPMEWDHIVPFFGRREIVKGSVYSYYEFASGVLLNDAEWREKLPAQAHPNWIAPFISRMKLSCPVSDPY